MPEKTEGATMVCRNCNNKLTCRMKDYGGNFQPTLQWQNKNGDAHYNTKDGKNFTCNIPELDESEIIVTSTKLSLDEEIAYIRNKVDLMFAMLSEQYQDYQSRKNQS